MEAAAAEKVGLSPGFKFNPPDDELVACFLLPRVRGQPVPFGGSLILDDNPRSAHPRDLLRRHGLTDEALFLAWGETKYSKGHRQDRVCAGGGTWKGQKTVDGKPLRVGDMEIGWQKYILNFHLEGDDGSSGWVMHEYTVTAPADLASSPWKLSRVRLGGYGQNQKRKRATQDHSEDEGEVRGATRRAYAAVSGEDHVVDDHAAAVSAMSDQDAQLFEDMGDLERFPVAPAPSLPSSGAAVSAMSDQDAQLFEDIQLPEGWEEILRDLESSLVAPGQ